MYPGQFILMLCAGALVLRPIAVIVDPHTCVGREEVRLSALPGGPADKLGNRYEDWWTLMRVADVLRGRATRIRLEPPGEAGAGAEFWIDEPGRRWYEQVKNAQHTWTLKQLIGKGVLPALVGHLRAGHHVRLVLSTTAPELTALSDRARAAMSLQEYTSMVLAQDERLKFGELARAWGIADSTAWEYLKRVKVEQQPAEHLRHLVHLTYEMLVLGDPEVVVNELRGWLNDMLHQVLTAPMIWAHLEAKGFRRNALAGEPTVVEALTATVERHRRRIDAARPVIGTVTHPYVSQILERLSAADGRQVLLVHGKAGSGKSTIAADALRELISVGWSAAVVRMDTADPVLQTAAALGRAFDLPGSPAVLLAGVADDSPAVLLVDQLDAVSTYSGRMPDSYDAVAELLDQVASLPNIKVVLAVRTADLKADSRIRSLLADESRVETLKIGDLALEDVRTALKRSSIDMVMLSQATLELLRVPLHLAIFSSLSSGSQTAPYRTLSDLYERFTDELRRDLGRQVGHLDWMGITGTLVRFMSEHERLDAPTAILDAADPAEVAALVSRGVLVKEGARIGWFHETYFDYLFARGFVASGGDLHDFLAESGQHLFRRAQIRQVLEFLAATDRDAFRRTVVRLLASNTVRLHLQDIAVTVLAGLDADAADWQAVEQLAFSGHKLGHRLAGLLSLPRWFDAADAAGRWEALLADPAKVDSAAHQLVIAARERPERVTALVSPYIGTSEAWRRRLRSLVEWSLTPGLVDLAVELIERGDLDDARGPVAVNSDFWSIIYGVHQEDPAGAARLIGAHLRRALARSEAENSADPFESGHLNPHSSAGGDSLIGEVAATAPAAFLQEVLPFVVRIAEVGAAGKQEYLRSSRRWRLRYFGDRHGIDNAVFTGTEDALRLLAQNQPEQGTALARELADTDVKELRFLACRTFAAADASNVGVDWLLSDERNLNLGWADNLRWASRELIEVATRSCNDARLDALTERLLEYYPSWEKTADNRRIRGWAQYELLTAVNPSRRNAAVTRRIAEWERKFTHRPPQAPKHDEAAHFVGPPITQAAAVHMTDMQWIRAINKYHSDKIDWSGDVPLGGARELAQLLGSRAEAEPERFARLALTFDADTPQAHLQQVIRAVAGKVPIPLLAELCTHARRVAGQSMGRTLCEAVETVAADADDTLMRLIQDCASDTNPDHESARNPAGSGQFHYNGDLLTAGLNSTRGAAAGAVAHLLFTNPERADQLIPTVAALATDSILAVRTWAAEAVTALLNADPQTAQDIAADLFDAPVDIFDANSTCRLLQYALIRQPDRFTPHLHRALTGPDPVAERAGQVWAVAFVHDLLLDPTPTKVADLCPAARRGATAAFATEPAVAPEQLIALFNDTEPAVREAAASAMRSVSDLDPELAQTLVAAFAASTAYEDHFEHLFMALHDSSQLLPEATIVACERAIDAATRELGDIRTVRAAMSNRVIAVILRLYRQGDELMRTRCLDLVDKLTEAGAYGLGKALAEER